jgi:hypothetical protein
VTLASRYGKAEDVYDGVDVNMNVRLRGGVSVSGGASWGRERWNTCFATSDPSINYPDARTITTSGVTGAATVTAPRTKEFCDVRPPFAPNVKFLAVYPLPWWGLQTSATYQGLPGQHITATRVYTNAEIAPSLGRTLASGANGTVTLDLMPPATRYTERLNQTNFRLTKSFRFGNSGRIQAMLDLYNLLNANSLLVINTAFNANWPAPVSVLQGRMVKFGTQIDF